jgi:hypothetical protein
MVRDANAKGPKPAGVRSRPTSESRRCILKLYNSEGSLRHVVCRPIAPQALSIKITGCSKTEKENQVLISDGLE